MPFKKVLLLEPEGGPWAAFLKDYFSDVPAELGSFHEVGQAPAYFDRASPDVLILESSFLTQAVRSKIKVRRNTVPAFRAFCLGEPPSAEGRSLFDVVFPELPEVSAFDKRFTDALPLPPAARLLVVDDEEEIGAMVRDHFEERQECRFEVVQAMNGRKALEEVRRRRPSVIILDIKMPEMDGREFYAKLKERDPGIPVIVYFDSISSEELAAMRRYGSPAVVEKGSSGSSAAGLLRLVKKSIYFSRETITENG